MTAARKPEREQEQFNKAASVKTAIQMELYIEIYGSVWIAVFLWESVRFRTRQENENIYLNFPHLKWDCTHKVSYGARFSI